MYLGLHSGCIMNTNIVTDIRIAKAAGYDGVELWIPKLKRYLDAGYNIEELIPAFGSLRPTMLDCVMSIEREEPDFRRQLRKDFEELGALAQQLNCPAIQVIALDALKNYSWPEMRTKLANSITELADVVAPFGIRLAIETVSFSPFHTLTQTLEVIDAIDRDNIGLVVDTWHLWTGGTPWEDVEALDPGLIVCAHISDTNPKQEEQWSDDDRTALPGDGVLPLKEGIDAILACGYDGVWSVEMLSKYHWEWDPELLALELKRRTEHLLATSMGSS